MVERRNKLTIKQWSEEDRPREKLKKQGRQSLSDAELLAILIGSGTPTEDALTIAQKLLLSVDSDLSKLSKQSIPELMKQNGIGEAKALIISACMELGQRRKDMVKPEKLKIQSSANIHNLMSEHFADLAHEEFWVIFLNRGNFIIDKKCMSKGGISGTVVDIRIILKQAIESLASSIILCHNHPSGNLKPSNEDILLTKKCKEAALLMDIKLLDHLIFHENKYYSFCDEGML
ncbi:MAG: DNA repair protein RadC [Sphingobacteriales bacterium]|jgi:DNA repair protein RadC|nr:DNA repair protein RadC [Sphingobacteriales bacterium]